MKLGLWKYSSSVLLLLALTVHVGHTQLQEVICSLGLT